MDIEHRGVGQHIAATRQFTPFPARMKPAPSFWLWDGRAEARFGLSVNLLGPESNAPHVRLQAGARGSRGGSYMWRPRRASPGRCTHRAGPLRPCREPSPSPERHTRDPGSAPRPTASHSPVGDADGTTKPLAPASRARGRAELHGSGPRPQACPRRGRGAPSAEPRTRSPGHGRRPPTAPLDARRGSPRGHLPPGAARLPAAPLRAPPRPPDARRGGRCPRAARALTRCPAAAALFLRSVSPLRSSAGSSRSFCRSCTGGGSWAPPPGLQLRASSAPSHGGGIFTEPTAMPHPGRAPPRAHARPLRPPSPRGAPAPRPPTAPAHRGPAGRAAPAGAGSPAARHLARPPPSCPRPAPPLRQRRCAGNGRAEEARAGSGRKSG